MILSSIIESFFRFICLTKKKVLRYDRADIDRLKRQGTAVILIQDPDERVGDHTVLHVATGSPQCLLWGNVTPLSSEMLTVTFCRSRGHDIVVPNGYGTVAIGFSCPYSQGPVK